MKCCQNGELSDRRRALPAMRYPHPLRHIGDPPLCSNAFSQSAEPVCVHMVTPPTPLAYGDIFMGTGCGSLFTKGGFYFVTKENYRSYKDLLRPVGGIERGACPADRADAGCRFPLFH